MIDISIPIDMYILFIYIYATICIIIRIVALWISVDVPCKDAILGMEGEHGSDTFDSFEGTCSTASLSEGSTKQRRHTRRNDRQRPFLGHSDKDNHVLPFLQGYNIYIYHIVEMMYTFTTCIRFVNLRLQF